MGLGARVSASAPVPPSDPRALRVGGAAQRLGGEGRGGGTEIFPVRSGNLQAPPPNRPPGRAKESLPGKKIEGSGNGGSRGRSRGGAGSEINPHLLRPAPASSLEGAGARPRALAASGGAGPACLLPTPPLQPRLGQKTGPLSPGPRRRPRAPRMP
ncbi:Spindlin-4 [Manis pentadactyla]|nr:Spindlin-4 [Manis pentadactyla]